MKAAAIAILMAASACSHADVVYRAHGVYAGVGAGTLHLTNLSEFCAPSGLYAYHVASSIGSLTDGCWYMFNGRVRFDEYDAGTEYRIGSHIYDWNRFVPTAKPLPTSTPSKADNWTDWRTNQ